MYLKHLFLTAGTLVACLVGAPGLVIFIIVAGSAPVVGGNVGPGGDIPPVALSASLDASAKIGSIVTGCVVPAVVLLAIGKVESDLSTTPIIGPALDGSLPGTAVVHDTDGGSLDGDPVWDHAVGPMQILPSTWRRWGRDANGDGVADPQDYADAAVTAAVILCQPPADLSDATALAAALHGYNNSDAYVADVMSVISTTSPLMSSTRSSSSRMPASTMRWYYPTVKRWC